MSHPAPEHRDGNAGFTLLEVLLSMLLLALLMAAIYAALAGSRRLVQGGLRQSRRDQQVLAVQQFLRHGLAQVRSVAIYDPAGIPARWLQGDERQLRYVAPGPAALGGRGLQVQQLQLVLGAGHPGRLELRQADLPLHGEPPHWRMPPEVLLDGLDGGHFAYRDTGTNGHSGRWLGRWTAPRRLPRLIDLQLQFQDRRPWPRLQVMPRIDPDLAKGPDIGHGASP